jgi:hypothetical protein
MQKKLTFYFTFALQYEACRCFQLLMPTRSSRSIGHEEISDGKLSLARISSLNIHDAHDAYTESTVNYSGANAYFQSHYWHNRMQPHHDHHNSSDQSKYFPSDEANENIYNGRILQSEYNNEQQMLRYQGLALVPSPTTHSNWTDLPMIAQNHIPELERIVSDLFPNEMMHCFWNPMVRGSAYDISRDDVQDGSEGISARTPSANIASLVHIDTDVGAYESLNDFLGLVENNQIQSDSSISTFDRSAFMHAIGQENKRFAVINFWRNTSDDPVESYPLAILSTRYNEESNAHARAFPDAIPDMDKSKWYLFPEATKDEVIVFYQYDRIISQPSDLWHCAISTDSENTAKDMHRESFDVRMLIVLDEEIEPDVDRYRPSRTRPILSLDESGCFCDEQAEKRQ